MHGNVARRRLGPPIRPVRSDEERSRPLFVVSYADEDAYEFWEGTRMRFGRDDEVCQITIWEELNERRLSRVAGELWCANAQMWVRNLSTTHELDVGSTMSRQVLPAAVPHVGAGPACSLPPHATVTAPSTGRWLLTVRPADEADADLTRGRIENIPANHRAVAEALCAPMVAGGTTPAEYAEIAASLACSPRAARRKVEALCEHYRPQIEALPDGIRPGETLTEAVARHLVQRSKLAVPPSPPSEDDSKGRAAGDQGEATP